MSWLKVLTRSLRPAVAALVLLTGVALTMSAAQVRAAAFTDHHSCQVPPCPSLGVPTPADPTEQPTPTGDTLALTPTFAATPRPTPSLPESGFSESLPVSQQQADQAAQFGYTSVPTNNTTFAAAPGFASIGIPMLAVFALVGLGAFLVRRRI